MWSVENEPQSKEVIKVEEQDNLMYFRSLWDKYRPEDIAAAGQKRFEDIILSFVEDSIQMTGIRNIALAGGCFANVKLNQKISELQQVESVYIHPNMNDGGLAVGAALLKHHEQRKKKKTQYNHIPWHSVFHGPEYSDDKIKNCLVSYGVDFEKPECISEEIARELYNGKVVAWFQGKMEYGPRALGHRSLLAPAINPGMNELLNNKLKRTEYMPFAPVILQEEAPKWLLGWKPCHVASYFMTITYTIEPTLAKKVPAVVHIDGTARPQVINNTNNILLHKTLKKYFLLSGIPLVINTSFNMHEEPIVCSPEDALKTFSRGAADVLAIGPYIVRS